MARAERWSQLKTGLIAFAAIIAAVAAVLYFARIGALHGDTTRLYMVTDQATGVISGTEVWLGGQKVGLVRDVGLRPPSADTSERVLITMDVVSKYLHLIRKDSDVQLRPGGSLIGAPVVAITVGTSRAPPIEARDTLRARAQLEERPGVADVASIGDSIVAISKEVGLISDEFDTTGGRVSTLRAKTENELGAAAAAYNRFATRATNSRGTVALILRDSARVRAEVSHLSAVADSIQRAADMPHGNIGRFRRDTSLVRNAKQILASVDSLRARVALYTGHAVGADSALAHQLTRVHAQLDSLVQDAKHHPLRYIAF